MGNHAHHDDAPTTPIRLHEQPAAPRAARPSRRAALIAAGAVALSLASGTAGAAAYALAQAPSTPAAVAVQAAPAVAPQPVVAPKATTASPSTTSRRASAEADSDDDRTTTRGTTSTSKPARSTSSKSAPSAAECVKIRDHYLYDSGLPNAAIRPQLRSQGCDDAADSLLVGAADG